MNINNLVRRSTAMTTVLALSATLAGVAAAKVSTNQCLNGEVVSMSRKALAVHYKGNKGADVTFSLTEGQYDAARDRNVRIGSQVKVCFKRGDHSDGRAVLKGKALHRKAAGSDVNEAPGNENAGPGVGGGGGGGGT